MINNDIHKSMKEIELPSQFKSWIELIRWVKHEYPNCEDTHILDWNHMNPDRTIVNYTFIYAQAKAKAFDELVKEVNQVSSDLDISVNLYSEYEYMIFRLKNITHGL